MKDRGKSIRQTGLITAILFLSAGMCFSTGFAAWVSTGGDFTHVIGQVNSDNLIDLVDYVKFESFTMFNYDDDSIAADTDPSEAIFFESTTRGEINISYSLDLTHFSNLSLYFYTDLQLKKNETKYESFILFDSSTIPPETILVRESSTLNGEKTVVSSSSTSNIYGISTSFYRTNLTSTKHYFHLSYYFDTEDIDDFKNDVVSVFEDGYKFFLNFEVRSNEII